MTKPSPHPSSVSSPRIMKAQHPRFSFSAIAAAIIAVVLLTVIAVQAQNAHEDHVTASVQR